MFAKGHLVPVEEGVTGCQGAWPDVKGAWTSRAWMDPRFVQADHVVFANTITPLTSALIRPSTNAKMLEGMYVGPE